MKAPSNVPAARKGSCVFFTSRLASFARAYGHLAHQRAALPALILALAVSGCDRAVDIPRLLLPGLGAQRPQIVLSNPSPRDRSLPENSQLFVDFDRPMNLERTQTAFSISGNTSVVGRPRWEANRLLFELEEPLNVGGSYLMRVGTGATSADGVSLQPEYLVHFVYGAQTAGQPKVISTFPEDNAQSAPLDLTIEVRFDRTMDLVQTEKAFRISPAADGEFTWADGNRTLQFTPRHALNSGSSYSVTIGTGAKDSEGATLAAAVSFGFRAGTDFVAPEVLGVYETGNLTALVEDYSGVGKDATFTIEFSEAMRYAAAQSAVSLQRLSTGGLADGEFEWDATFRILKFSPSAALEPQQNYQIEVAPSALDLSGNGLVQKTTVKFQVNASAGLLHSDFLSITEAQKVSPEDPELLALSPDVFSVLTLPASGGVLGDSMRISVLFSLPLLRGSVPTNVSLRKLNSNATASGSLVGISFAPFDGQNDRELRLDFEGIGSNDYLLEISGGRSGIRSAGALGESPTWLSDDIKLYLRIVP